MSATPSALETTAQTVPCPRCRKRIDILDVTSNRDYACPLCGKTFEAVRFDAPAGMTAAPQIVDGSIEAQPCAVHARNAAVANCERCGAFMCTLCRIDVDGRTLCPACFERLSAEGSIESTRTTFRDYSGLSSVTAVAGCLFGFLAIILGPLAVFYGVKALRQKKAMDESDGRIGIWAAMIIGGLQTIGGIALLGVIIMGLAK